MIKNIVLFILMFGIASCLKKDDGYKPTYGLDYTSTFAINNYLVNNNDYKSIFNGYTFQFSTQGKLVANKNGGTVDQADYRQDLDSVIVARFMNTDLMNLNRRWYNVKFTTHTLDLDFKDGVDDYHIQWLKQ